MQDAMDAVGKMNKSIKTLGKKNSTKHLSSTGQELAEIVREATGKALKRPDPTLNQQVVDLIGAAVNADGPRAVAKIISERLDQKNYHKVWLAIMLIREVLAKAMKELGPAREDIMTAVEKVATAPMDRFDKNLKDQQSTKHAAYELLKAYGHDGHILSQPQHEQEEADRRAYLERQQARQSGQSSGGHSSRQADIREQVRTQLPIADYQIGLLQELLLDKTDFHAKSPQDQTLAKDVLLEANKFVQTFEKLLGSLSASENPDAQKLMAESLEKMDILNNSLALHKEAIKSEAEKITGKPFEQIKTPRKGGGQKQHTPRTKPPAEEASLIDFQETPTASQPPQGQGQSYDPFAASTPSGHQQGSQNQPGPSTSQSRPPTAASASQQAPQQQNPYHQGQAPPYNQNPYASQQNPYTNQPGTSGQFNPLQPQHSYPGQSHPQQFPGQFQQQFSAGSQPQYGYGGGFGQQYPNYGQPPPNYGTPYQHPHLGFGNPYTQGPQQWGQQQGFGRPPQGFGGGFPGQGPSQQLPPYQPPMQPQSSLQSQFSAGSEAAIPRPPQQQQPHQIPIYTADIVIKEPQRESAIGSAGPAPSGSQLSGGQGAAPGGNSASVAASMPITETAQPKDVGFGESAFPHKAAAQSPVPPSTPANQPSNSRPGSGASSAPTSAEKPKPYNPPSTTGGGSGFESSAFGAPAAPSHSAGQVAASSGPTQAAPASAAPTPDSDWEMFFNERASGSGSGGPAKPSENVTNQFGNLSVNPKH